MKEEQEIENEVVDSVELTREEIETSTMFRNIKLDRSTMNEESRTISLAFSSENPVNRWFGEEVLSHDTGAVRLNRLNDGGALLVDHDPTDHVGVVESASIDNDRVGRAVVRFGNGVRASEIWQDVKDGIRKNVSVGYVIHEMREESKDEKTGVGVFRATDWQPVEVSLVSIPADPTVGVHRNDDSTQSNLTVVHRSTQKKSDNNIVESVKKHMEESVNKDVESDAVAASPSPNEVRANVRDDARREELARIQSIESLGSQHDNTELARKFIAEGNTIDEFKSALLERVATPVAVKRPEVGMDKKDVERFSFKRAINALSNPHDRRAQEAAAFEFEASRAACDAYGVESRGLRIPDEVLHRDNTVGTAADGGNLVGTDTQGFIDMLRATSIAMQRGTVMSGLVGDVAIPRQTGGATAYWLAEAGAPTETKAAFDQVTMSPKTVGAWVDISRKLTQQSSVDVEALIRNDLAATLGTAIDAVAINGGGTNEPDGILQTTGIGAVVGGTNGAAPDWADIVDLESAVAVDNALNGALAYMSNYKVAGKLKQTDKASSFGEFILDGGEVNGYEFLLTNQVPSTLTKGSASNVCSAIIFGNWADLMMGMWGGLDLTVDPYSESTKGTIRVVAFQDVDVALRHAESFAAMQDALTT